MEVESSAMLSRISSLASAERLPDMGRLIGDWAWRHCSRVVSGGVSGRQRVVFYRPRHPWCGWPVFDRRGPYAKGDAPRTQSVMRSGRGRTRSVVSMVGKDNCTQRMPIVRVSWIETPGATARERAEGGEPRTTGTRG